MSDTARSPQVFARLKATPRKRAPLSFDDLTATLAAAQHKTGFVDTLATEKPTLSRDASDATGSGASDTNREAPATVETISPPVPPAPEPELRPDAARRDDGASSAGSLSRKGRVRASHVQCNLKIAEELRDALHLQALRERRTIAALVTEVMSVYLTQQGTFERLR